MNANTNLRTKAKALAESLNAVSVRVLGWNDANRKDWRSKGWRETATECAYHRNEILAAHDDREIKRACRAAARFLSPSCFPEHADIIPDFCDRYWIAFA